MTINEQLCSEFKLKPFQIDNTVSLIDQGNTIPFIARYRKEMTGELDDQILRDIYDRLNYLRSLEKRKEPSPGNNHTEIQCCKTGYSYSTMPC